MGLSLPLKLSHRFIMTKYGIKHKVTGKYFAAKLNGVFYYQDNPKINAAEYYSTMTEALLNIIPLEGEGFLEVFQYNFDE
jgi:hypothetical protein